MEWVDELVHVREPVHDLSQESGFSYEGEVEWWRDAEACSYHFTEGKYHRWDVKPKTTAEHGRRNGGVDVGPLSTSHPLQRFVSKHIAGEREKHCNCCSTGNEDCSDEGKLENVVLVGVCMPGWDE